MVRTSGNALHKRIFVSQPFQKLINHHGIIHLVPTQIFRKTNTSYPLIRTRT